MEVTSFRGSPNLSMADLLFLFCGVPQLLVLHLIGVVGSDGPEVIEDFHSCVVVFCCFFLHYILPSMISFVPHLYHLWCRRFLCNVKADDLQM